MEKSVRVFLFLIFFGLCAIGYFLAVSRQEGMEMILLFSMFLLFAGVFPFVRDLIAGVVLRVENKIVEGSHIRFSNISGKVKHLSLRCITVQTDEGHELLIPYQTVNREIVTLLDHAGRGEPISFTLLSPKIARPGAMIEIIRKSAMNLIWVDPNTRPVITFVEELENKYRFTITLHPIIQEYRERIEDLLKAELAK